MQGAPQHLISFRVRGVVEIFQGGHLASRQPSFGQQGGEPLVYLLVPTGQHIHRRIGEIYGARHQATRSERAPSANPDRSRPPPYPNDCAESEKSICTLSNASTMRSASMRSACIRNASLMVATFVSVPSTCRAASSHSSFTSTVMRVMPLPYTKIVNSIHQIYSPLLTEHT